LDRWLTTVSRDHTNRSRSHKILADKPANITDRCYDGAGQQLAATLCPLPIVNVEETPRQVAGGAITNDNSKCRLKPLTRGSYGSVRFTDAQWTQLQRSFPHGVCDFSKPGVGQRPTVPWLTYQDSRGHVIYGGRPLEKAPKSRAF
jgi:hypothetical protein